MLELIENDYCFNITNVTTIEIVPKARIPPPAINSLYARCIHCRSSNCHD
jgi:hypothetical protein